MDLRHTAALAIVTCVLSIPATTFYGQGISEFGIPTRAACEERLKALGSLVGWHGERAHCDCSYERPSSKEIPKPHRAGIKSGL